MLDALIQSRRHRNAAKRVFRKLLKGLHYAPWVIVTDKLGSYQVARRERLTSVEHRRSKYVNNRAENSHQPTRKRERAMKRFASPGHAQRYSLRFLGYFPAFPARLTPGNSTREATEIATDSQSGRKSPATDDAAPT